MRAYHFPNIRRSDDPATVWLDCGLLRHLEDPADRIQAAVLFRAFGGKQETGEALAPMYWGSGWDEGLFLSAVGPLEKPFSATIVGPHLRMRTLADVARAGCDVRRQFGYWPLIRGASHRDAHRALCGIPKMGPEMAYEVVCDLRRAGVIQTPIRGDSWALPGTSAVLAAGRITDNEWRHTRRDDRAGTVQLMRDLLAEAQTEYPDWEISEVQRALTLYHFWAREARPARRYRWNR